MKRVVYMDCKLLLYMHYEMYIFCPVSSIHHTGCVGVFVSFELQVAGVHQIQHTSHPSYGVFAITVWTVKEECSH
jgi:hypothetical protein